MRRCGLIPTVVLWSCLGAIAQERLGSIRGVVMDKDFDTTLAGVEVLIVEIGVRTKSGDQGNFVFGQVVPGQYTLVFSKEGYVRLVKAEVPVTAGKLTDVNAALAGDFTDMEEVVVQDVLEIGGGTEFGLLQMRFESPALMDSIGKELMSRAGASDAASALRLVSGASLQDGKSAVIRGLPDRYVSSQMNGIRLPTADENKRAVELDQFSAAIIESIQVTKTFTPDQQGDASGGAVDVRLKGIPEQTFFIEAKGKYSQNSQAAGRKDFLTSEGGGVSYWGKDKGSRNIQYENLGKSWKGAAGVSEGEAPADYQWSGSVGGKHDFGDELKLGGFASFYYERDSAFHDNGVDNSYWVEKPGTPMSPHTYQGTAQDGDFKTALYDVVQSKQSVKWGDLVTMGIESKDHRANVVYSKSRTTEDTVTLAEDTRGKSYFFPGYDPADPKTPGYSSRDSAPYLRLETLGYTERETETFMFSGRHTLVRDLWGIRSAPVLDWTLAHSSASLDQPDKRQFGSLWIPGRQVGSIKIPPTHSPYKPAANFTLGNFQRTWKKIEEESDQYATNLELPFEVREGCKGYLKVGVFHDSLDRTFDQENFSNFGDNSTYGGPFQDRWSKKFPSENHPISESLFDVDYKGKQEISASYVMADLPILANLDLIGGARFEGTSISIVNDPEENATWYPPGSLAPTKLNRGDADVGFKQHDVLPALALVYRPLGALTLRASYSETVARQTFKELTPILQQEYLGGPVFIGNPELKMSALRNYDVRCDWTPYQGGLLSASWFRKDIRNPIEYVQRISSFDFTTAVNYPRGRLSGFELECRQSLGRLWEAMDGLAVGANATFIDSRVTLPADEAAGFERPNIKAPMVEREMTNAPNRLYNLFATYDIAATGTQLGVFYTVQGDSLVAGAAESNGNYLPNVFAAKYDTLNVSLSQKLGRFFTLQLGAKNLTNPEIKEVYRSPYIGDDVLKTSYTSGVEYSVGIFADIRF